MKYSASESNSVEMVISFTWMSPRTDPDPWANEVKS